MLLRYFYHEQLAQASYLVGCQRTGEAVVIDPQRNIEAYLRIAQQEGLRIVGALETHIHADFVSGARELAHQTQATLYLSGEGGPDWQYARLDGVAHQIIYEGDTLAVGNLRLEVMHTPGHTPESLSFLLKDYGSAGPQSIGIFTGDFVFVGDVGRPDLLEKAAGQAGTAEIGARQMYKSLQRFKEWEDYLQIWPGHGAGSACGKALGAVPSSTVGYEKRYNPALSFTEEAKFVTWLLDGQPEPPRYFSRMKQVNKQGATLIADLPHPKELQINLEVLQDIRTSEAILLDTRLASVFAQNHLNGSLSIPHQRSFCTWAGWLLDEQSPLYIIGDKEGHHQILSDLRAVGIDHVTAIVDSNAIQKNIDLSPLLKDMQEMDVMTATPLVYQQDVTLIDVRNSSEWLEGHLPHAVHIPLGSLQERLDEISKDKPILVQCRSGARSAIAVSLLESKGFENLINLKGGILAWNQAGLETISTSVTI
ncbi:MBL fold metallo-hydrolase [Brevibacillus laterosporus]|uniref:MBL fold metallo-hydrolase n=1 Tax=Brevibacillus laterosporus TaxID=1465 RepID=A0AAP3DES2_BRELA|nr:MBL fold metallo-hydrolase [Brevibacillus laterosporus]MCR8978619.1 MBL fold metallo-hydrolase [Brevibacillus laterosporus]MCZ0805775.1 MBL fold metallo-hydrolase [Brevibacillus laterosporus]MCZ0824459.1 MBL fold metallo-hydrolase [Brevibacillus laterosporus]MCZ0848363.1 MBL fold metallo-hydrolase [Brevibacillus laterosporus]